MWVVVILWVLGIMGVGNMGVYNVGGVLCVVWFVCGNAGNTRN